MLIDQDPRAFESNTVNGTSAFTIAASSKAFQILSNQLYTDKPRAILRELSTNALDAHIAAGKADVPFEVQLPTTWDSTLIVKDFGTGMSPEQIKCLYTTYFGSDKTHTNDLVGGLGLGSKSPFAYTDQFTAISRHEGTKYTYAAFIGAANVPEISLVAQEDTDEPNGFEVHVPIKEADIYTFEKTAKRVFEFFEIKPTLNQPINFTEYDEPVMTLNYDGIECQLFSDQDNTIVMQGPIGYPVDSWAVMSELEYSKRSKVETFLQKGWRIKAPVGTFEITASREALSYDKKTIAKLLETAHNILNMVKQQAVDKLASVNNLEDAAALMVASGKYLPGAMSLEGTPWNGMSWNGHCFEVDLPPDVQVREMKRRRYGRGNDPHETDIYTETLRLTKLDYRIYWSEKDRPYKGFVGNNPAQDGEHILYFTGPVAHIKTWLESVGLPTGMEMPKPVKGAAGTGRKVNYGATKYNGYCLTTGKHLHATANDIVDEVNAYIILADDTGGSLFEYQKQAELLKSLLPDTAFDDDVYVFYVHDTHTKVRKAIEAHPGLINRELWLELCYDMKTLMHKLALIDALCRSYKSALPYQDLGQILNQKLVDDSEVVAFLEKLKAITEARRGGYDIDSVKGVLNSFDLNYDAAYEQEVQRLSKGQIHDLRHTYNKYKGVMDAAMEANKYNNSWRYQDSSLQAIVTEWFNMKIALEISTQNQEVA